MRVKYFIITVLCLSAATLFVASADDNPPKQTDPEAFPQFPDMVYEYHITELNKATPIDFAYNQYVRRYIDIFTLERRSQVERFLGLADLYFPVFEEHLSRYGLPLELKYLAVIESGLDPLARSSSDAIGLWQFLYHSAQMFDLRISSYVDERSDVYKSTDAACRYLKYLYRTFGDWNLALAAYNGGPGELEKAIVRSGGKTNFWDLYPYITEAMRNYVPAFIAINYVFDRYGDHRLNVVPCDQSFYDLDTLHVRHKISLASVAKKTGMDETVVRRLNPCYRTGEIPESDKPMILVLPKDKAIAFLEAENKIISARKNTETVLPENRQGMTAVSYFVQKGDFMHKIAIRYGCTIEDIRRWNNLSDKNLSAGMKLVIWIRQD